MPWTERTASGRVFSMRDFRFGVNELAESMNVLVDSQDEVVAKLHFTVIDPGEAGLADLTRVIDAVR